MLILLRLIFRLDRGGVGIAADPGASTFPVTIELVGLSLFLSSLTQLLFLRLHHQKIRVTYLPLLEVLFLLVKFVSMKANTLLGLFNKL